MHSKIIQKAEKDSFNKFNNEIYKFKPFFSKSHNNKRKTFLKFQ